MRNPIYNLPELSFVGGESQTFLFNLLTSVGSSFDAGECELGFAIVNYANKSGAPVVTKDMSVQLGEDGVPNMAIVNLLPEDTVTLYGRYIYQITIKDALDETEIPGQGILDITRNIHRGFITE